MWKAVLAGTTALVLAGSSLVYAQQRPGGQGPDRGWRGPSMEDMRAFGDARLAALKAGLELTPDQEKNWPAFEQAARELAKLRYDRIAARRDRFRVRLQMRRPGGSQQQEQQQQQQEQQQQPQQQPQQGPAGMIDRLRQRGTAMAETGTALKKLADAADPLYNSLDDSQKRRFAILSHMRGPGAGRPGFFRGRGFQRDRDGQGREGQGRGMYRDHRRTELMPGEFGRDRQFEPGRRGPWRNGFGRGHERGSDRTDRGRSENL